MKLVVHAGTHKTATTAFQMFCWSARLVFAESGFYYPDLKYGSVDVFQHSPLVWSLQEGRRLDVFKILCNFYQNAVSLGCHSVLISGEDFENFLIDSAAQLQFEQMLYDAGFDDLEWVIVRREPLDYFQSLYSELSKHGACVSALPAAMSVVRSGWFAVSTANLNYFFAIDIVRLLGAFRARTRGNVRVYKFSDFVASEFLGAGLLRDCFGFAGMDEQVLAAHLALVNEYKNICLSADMVEINYLSNFLGRDSVLTEIEQVEWSESLASRKKSLEASLELLTQHCSTGEC